MEYTIQPSDTVANVTKRLGTDWNSLKKANPTAVGKSQFLGIHDGLLLLSVR